MTRGILLGFLLLIASCGGREDPASGPTNHGLQTCWDRVTGDEIKSVAMATDGRVLSTENPVTAYAPSGDVTGELSTDCVVSQVAAHPDGGWVVAGMSSDCMLGDAHVTPTVVAEAHVVVARLTPDLAVVWARMYPAWQTPDCGALCEGPLGVFAVGAAQDGDALVAGAFIYSIDFGAGPLSVSVPKSDIFVAKLAAADGAPVWSTTLTSTDTHNWGYEYPRSLTGNAGGDVVIGGWLGGAGAFAAKLDGATGAERWVAMLDLDYGYWGYDAVVPSASGDLFAAGGRRVLEAGSPRDVGVVRLAGADGSPLWSQTYGNDPSEEFGYAATVGAGDEVLVAGDVSGEPDLGGGTFAVGQKRGFAAAYSPDDGSLLATYVSSDPRSARAAASDGNRRYVVAGRMGISDTPAGGFITCLERTP